MSGDAERSYVLVVRPDGRTGIRCLGCGLTSWNPKDVANRYCGFCHAFHEEPGP
jgi:hypothetical protein